jgi:hypothetical protein
VFLRLVVPTLSAELWTRMQHAPVYRISLAEHRNADPSVPSTPNVAPTSHANVTNALTLVLAHVALSPHVGWLTTSQCVLALPVTLVIPSAGVHPLQVRFAPTFPPLYFHIFLLRPPLCNYLPGTEPLFVSMYIFSRQSCRSTT